ncbi:hypothetical protein CJ030_MR3G009482 [Morella rubra]|uniref:Uncharacterized protein n=1 Tax=Morella rubra TaxID=262757 RepID=A0A6A1WAJ9_9ROSI|nr:hypothetical protein CJ030_MR3G009482 [Morella rubra]
MEDFPLLIFWLTTACIARHDSITLALDKLALAKIYKLSANKRWAMAGACRPTLMPFSLPASSSRISNRDKTSEQRIKSKEEGITFSKASRWTEVTKRATIEHN